jgi:tetratricopeptide (TPR) repeat protein
MLRTLLGLFVLLAPLPASADWYEASSEHFVVYAPLAPDKLQDFATRLERFDAAMRWMQGFKDEVVGPANRVTVYMTENRGEAGKLAGDQYVAGFYHARAGDTLAVVPRSTGPSDSTDLNAQQILLHEYAHHLMWTFSPNAVYPAWYVEGFAETFATARFYPDGSIDIGRPPQYRGYGLLSGNGLPIRKLLVAETLKLSPEQRDALYGRGWLLTDYLMLSGQRKGQLETYLKAINAGKPPMEAAAAFGDLARLDGELERFKTDHFRVFKLPPDELHVAPITLRKLSAGEAATMPVRIRSKVGVDQKTAPDVYARAKRLAMPYPEDAAAQLRLAEAAFDVRDYAASEAAADRAIKADAKAVDGYVYKAMSQMAVATQAHDKRPETWKAIRQLIAAGNRIDPNNPKPLILYFRSFTESGAAPTQNAKLGLQRAFELCPQDDTLRFNVAAMYLRDGHKDDASALLKPLAYDPHGGDMAQAAAALVTLIDSGAGDAALKALDAAEKAREAEGSKES